MSDSELQVPKAADGAFGLLLLALAALPISVSIRDSRDSLADPEAAGLPLNSPVGPLVVGLGLLSLVAWVVVIRRKLTGGRLSGEETAPPEGLSLVVGIFLYAACALCVPSAVAALWPAAALAPEAALTSAEGERRVIPAGGGALETILSGREGMPADAPRLSPASGVIAIRATEADGLRLEFAGAARPIDGRIVLRDGACLTRGDERWTYSREIADATAMLGAQLVIKLLMILLFVGLVLPLAQGGDIDRRSLGLSTKDWPREVGRGLLLYLCALPLIFGLVVVAKALGELWGLQPIAHPLQASLAGGGWGAAALACVIAVLLAPIEEELTFRGVYWPALARSLGRWPGVVVSAGLFAAMHMGFHPLLPIFGLGLLLGGLAATAPERSIVSCITVHVVHNGLTMTLFFAGGAG